MRPTGTIVPQRRQLLARSSATDTTISVAGVTTGVLWAGDGPPMVLLHGPGEFGGTWLPVLDDLARTHRVIAPDLPGHGASDAPDGGIDAAFPAAWLGDLIDATCPTPPVLVGRGVGGAIAAEFAARHPDRITAAGPRGHDGAGALRPGPAVRAGAASVPRRPEPGLLRAAHGLLRLRPRHGPQPARRPVGALLRLRRRAGARPAGAGGDRRHDRSVRRRSRCPTRRWRRSPRRPPSSGGGRTPRSLSASPRPPRRATAGRCWSSTAPGTIRRWTVRASSSRRCTAPSTPGAGHDGVRRHRGGRPLRGLPDRDAAGPARAAGAGRRPGAVPQRHRLDPHRASAGRDLTAALGPESTASADVRPSTRTSPTSARSS